MNHIAFGASSVALVASDFLFPGGPIGVALGIELGLTLPGPVFLGSIAVRHNTLGGLGTITYVVRVGGIDTALTVAVAAATSNGIGSAPTILVPENTLISIRADKAALLLSPLNISIILGD